MRIKIEEKQIKWGLTAFIVVVCCILAFFIIYRLDAVSNACGVVISILTPFLYGLVMAYLLCPVYNFVVRVNYAFLKKG